MSEIKKQVLTEKHEENMLLCDRLLDEIRSGKLHEAISTLCDIKSNCIKAIDF